MNFERAETEKSRFYDHYPGAAFNCLLLNQNKINHPGQSQRIEEIKSANQNFRPVVDAKGRKTSVHEPVMIDFCITFNLESRAIALSIRKRVFQRRNKKNKHLLITFNHQAKTALKQVPLKTECLYGMLVTGV